MSQVMSNSSPSGAHGAHAFRPLDLDAPGDPTSGLRWLGSLISKISSFSEYTFWGWLLHMHLASRVDTIASSATYEVVSRSSSAASSADDERETTS